MKDTKWKGSDKPLIFCRFGNCNSTDVIELTKYQECATCGIHWKGETGLYYCDFHWEGMVPHCGDSCGGEEARPFNTATYYTCDDSVEQLSHETWEEAIEEHIDGWFDPTKPARRPMDEIMAEISSLTVYAWKRKEIDPRFGEHAVDDMFETLDDDWHDDYGDCDGDACVFGKEELKKLKEKFYALMRKSLKNARPWQCDVVTERLFNEDELTTLMKAHNPHWWEKEENSDRS